MQQHTRHKIKNKSKTIPEHLAGIQEMLSTLVPVQSAPPNWGSGLSHFLNLLRCPTPHVRLQGSHSIQLPQSPFTESNKRENKLKCCVKIQSLLLVTCFKYCCLSFGIGTGSQNIVKWFLLNLDMAPKCSTLLHLRDQCMFYRRFLEGVCYKIFCEFGHHPHRWLSMLPTLPTPTIFHSLKEKNSTH